MQLIQTFPNGKTFYFYNDDLHREDGPAVEYPDGRKYWLLHGEAYVFSRYLEKLSETKSDKEIFLLRLKYT
jgi:hypothetical protein